MNHVRSKDLCESSYLPGLVNADLHSLFPAFISKRLALAFEAFGKKASRFLTNDACCWQQRPEPAVRCESRAILIADAHRLCGALPLWRRGWVAGGIVSAAMDGVACAESVKEYLGC